MRVVLAEVRGFCAGVQRAIDIVEIALQEIWVANLCPARDRAQPPCRGSPARQGCAVCGRIERSSRRQRDHFQCAWGVASVRDEADERGHKVIDATCPLVLRVHNDGGYYAAQGREVMLIGHAGHPEVEGTHGPAAGGRPPIWSVERGRRRPRQGRGNAAKVAYITQTTLSVDDTRAIIDALRERFPPWSAPTPGRSATPPRTASGRWPNWPDWSTWCWWWGRATARTPTGCARIAEARGVPDPSAGGPGRPCDPEWIAGRGRVGITAGASAPDDLVQGLIESLRPSAPSSSPLCPG